MEKLQALMESEEMQLFVENNQELINETSSSVDEFIGIVKQYVVDNPEVFVESEIDDMKKNIRVFAETAVAQYLTEITAINAAQAKIVVPVTPENALDEYI